MSKKFDPDKSYVKIRGMGGIHYEQNGQKFSAGFQHIGPVDGKPPKKADKPSEDVRSRAAKKIAAKRKKKEDDPLDGIRGKETPDAVSSALQENEAARQAEENA